MKTRHTTAWFALATAVAGACGCAASTASEDEQDVAVQEQPLFRGSGGVQASYTCSNGSCTCDKSIENDCEDMSGVCTDASIDALIQCINGWLTTHCTCPQAFRTNPTTTVRAQTAKTAAFKAF